MPDVSPSGHGSGALSFMPVRGSCVPCSGALSDSQESPPHGSAPSVVSAQSAAARAGSSRFHRGEPSGACTALRPCRRSGTPQGIPAAEAVLRALTFSALGAPSGNRTTAAETLPGTPETGTVCTRFGPSVLSCTSDFDRKNSRKSKSGFTFCPSECLPRLSPCH